MKYSKKVTAVILSLIMLLTMIPAMAFAEESTDQVAAESAEEITEEAVVEEEEEAEEQPEEEVLTEETETEATEEEAVTEEPEEETVVESEESDADTEEEAVTEEPAEESTEVVVEEEAVEEEEEADAEEGYGEISSSDVLDEDNFEDVDSEDLFEEFLYDGVESSDNTSSIKRSNTAKGNRLYGNNYKYYKRYKSIMTNVSAAKTAKAYKKISMGTFFGHRKITAKQLGVSKIGYKKNGVWYMTAAAEKKLKAYIDPGDLNKVTTCLFYDMPEKGYWVDWYNSREFFKWNCRYSYNANSLTLTKSSYILFKVPVSYEYRKGTAGYTVDLSLIKAANTAKKNAKSIVKTFNESYLPYYTQYGYTAAEIDYYRLRYYYNRIAALTEYDDYAASSYYIYDNGPWTMIPVFDGDSSTDTVCEGYSKAFKYLCNLSTFKSKWIDCQVVSGDAGGDHMWNIVRMNDGLNYLVDITWGDEGSYADSTWFLRGAPSGTANTYTIEGTKRTYDSQTKKIFAKAERKLSKKDNYEVTTSAKIKLKGTSLYKPVRAKKGFTLKWKKMGTPCKSVYIDGYQIRYSTKKNMKGAKYVKVRGVSKTKKKISKLKSKKYYYVQIRTYVKLGKKTFYSSWSKKRKVKTK